jgi:hypothetical protein
MNMPQPDRANQCEKRTVIDRSMPTIIRIAVLGGVAQPMGDIPPGIEVHIFDYDGEGPEDFEDEDKEGTPCNVACYIHDDGSTE